MILAKDYDHLWLLIDKEMNANGPTCSLNHIDVSGIEEMDGLFKEVDFNGDISQWNVSNVRNMSDMFFRSTFNGDISKWNVSKVEDMGDMFLESPFNRNLSDWDVSSNQIFRGMFSECPFAGDISKWKITNHHNFRDFLGTYLDSPRDTRELRLPTIHASIDTLFGIYEHSPQHLKIQREAQREWLKGQPLGRFHWEFMGKSLNEPWVTLNMKKEFLALRAILDLTEMSMYEQSHILYDKWIEQSQRMKVKEMESNHFDFESSM